jgi:hypothetical protein
MKNNNTKLCFLVFVIIVGVLLVNEFKVINLFSATQYQIINTGTGVITCYMSNYNGENTFTITSGHSLTFSPALAGDVSVGRCYCAATYLVDKVDVYFPHSNSYNPVNVNLPCSGGSTTTTTIPMGCSDSDDEDYFSRGTVTYNGVSVQDTCYQNLLQEEICYNGYEVIKSIQCSNACIPVNPSATCLSGRCICSTSATTTTHIGTTTTTTLNQGTALIDQYIEPSKTVMGDSVRVHAFLVNDGGDMKVPNIIELQLRPHGLPLLGGIIGNQEVCDINHPENVHRNYLLSAGTVAHIELSTKAISSGSYDVWLVTRSGCGGSSVTPYGYGFAKFVGTVSLTVTTNPTTTTIPPSISCEQIGYLSTPITGLTCTSFGASIGKTCYSCGGTTTITIGGGGGVDRGVLEVIILVGIIVVAVFYLMTKKK